MNDKAFLLSRKVNHFNGTCKNWKCCRRLPFLCGCTRSARSMSHTNYVKSTSSELLTAKLTFYSRPKKANNAV